MRNKRTALLVPLAFLLLSGCTAKPSTSSSTGTSVTQPVSGNQSGATSYHDNIYLAKTDSVKGSYMTDFAGMTLYTFDKDGNGVSNCDATCVKTWKPYSSGATAQKQF